MASWPQLTADMSGVHPCEKGAHLQDRVDMGIEVRGRSPCMQPLHSTGTACMFKVLAPLARQRHGAGVQGRLMSSHGQAAPSSASLTTALPSHPRSAGPDPGCLMCRRCAAATARPRPSFMQTLTAGPHHPESAAGHLQCQRASWSWHNCELPTELVSHTHFHTLMFVWQLAPRLRTRCALVRTVRTPLR